MTCSLILSSYRLNFNPFVACLWTFPNFSKSFKYGAQNHTQYCRCDLTSTEKSVTIASYVLHPIHRWTKTICDPVYLLSISPSLPNSRFKNITKNISPIKIKCNSKGKKSCTADFQTDSVKVQIEKVICYWRNTKHLLMQRRETTVPNAQESL